MTREIPLSRGFTALVDDEDYDRVVAAGPWRTAIRGRKTYAQRHGRPCLLHSFLTGYPLVDHINGDGLDNRRGNLRAATGTQNNANAVRHIDNTSGFKGVYRTSSKINPWRAEICVAGDRRHVGMFPTPDEAAQAYDRAAIAAFGEYARPNFPQQEPAA